MAELRAIRAQIAAECDYDFAKLVERAQAIQRAWKGPVVTKEGPPEPHHLEAGRGGRAT